ncbi:MAG: undecaprenyldiphospho-muramoylpentapeptide beta-N-acetylglucosaminyltransferase [Proteobacteria bacterium]|nr:undecaprenyldiphospho-muramoylpentapeptide beta-N-acetylglucosaminyltransferase [Pseudomonadota bacterium]MBW3616606.1 undecaprenyldiphospho-muramoylpentapeptide beta-N-acetylglucosaminyltransferase [Pseudomonadota bacterium]
MNRFAVVAAGGTGGHLFPAEALARVLAGRGWRIALATDSRGARFADHFPAEERIALEAATFKPGDLVGMVRANMRIQAGAAQARKAFARFDPAVVVGFGGYPSLPALMAARSQRRPTLIHEQNSVLGRVNRYMAPKVDAVACAFPTLLKAPKRVKAQVVGNPIRPEIRALHDRPFPSMGGTIRILVTGGSQGARLLSEFTPAAIINLPEDLRLRVRVEQQTRMENLDLARTAYREAGVEAEVAPFFRNMAARLEKAHLVIGRAGASTVCELAVAGKPSILVPLKIAADDHQTSNAKLLTDAGAAVVIREDKFTPEALGEAIRTMLNDPEGLGRRAEAARSVAAPEAAERLADLVERTARA